MQQKVCSLLVRRVAIGDIVRILTLVERDDEPPILGCVLVGLERVPHADDVLESPHGRRVQLLLQDALHVGCEAFVQPEVRHVSMSVSWSRGLVEGEESRDARYAIAEPGVG